MHALYEYVFQWQCALKYLEEPGGKSNTVRSPVQAPLVVVYSSSSKFFFFFFWVFRVAQLYTASLYFQIVDKHYSHFI